MSTKELDEIWNGENEAANVAGLVITTLKPGLIADMSVTKEDSGWLSISFRYKGKGI